MNHAQILSALENLLEPRGLILIRASGPDPHAMGGWYAEYQSGEFVLIVVQDRAGDVVCIEIGSRIRIRPRAHMRGPWSLFHLRGFLEDQADHYEFARIEDQIDWLRENSTSLFQTSLLNSDLLNQWAVSTSRRMFKPRD